MLCQTPARQEEESVGEQGERREEREERKGATFQHPRGGVPRESVAALACIVCRGRGGGGERDRASVGDGVVGFQHLVEVFWLLKSARKRVSTAGVGSKGRGSEVGECRGPYKCSREATSSSVGISALPPRKIKGWSAEGA
eukprot:1625027-Rhodomonas_salina.1